MWPFTQKKKKKLSDYDKAVIAANARSHYTREELRSAYRDFEGIDAFLDTLTYFDSGIRSTLPKLSDPYP